MTCGSFRIRGLLAAIVAVLSLGGAAAAQSTYSAIDGTVVDQQQGLLPGVTVTVTNEETGFMRTGVTNERGRYRIGNLPPGRYAIKVELTGFATQEKRGVVLAIGSEISIDFAIKVAAIE